MKISCRTIGGKIKKMNKVIKITFVNCLSALLFVASVHSQTLNQIQIKVYDGYAYFDSSSYQAIPNARVFYNKTEFFTDSLGNVTLNIANEKDTSVFINAPDFGEQHLNLSKYFKHNSKCSISDSIEVFLGLPGAYYGYKNGKRVPFDLRENSFSILINDDNKSAVLELIPEKYRKHLGLVTLNKGQSVKINEKTGSITSEIIPRKRHVTPFKGDVSELSGSYFLIVDSVPKKELYQNELFRKIRNTGAELGPITKDLEMIISPSLMVQPCGSVSSLQLREEISNTYPQLKVNYDPTMFPYWITISLPQNICFDMFEWFEKIDNLDFVGRIDLNHLRLIRYD